MFSLVGEREGEKKTDVCLDTRDTSHLTQPYILYRVNGALRGLTCAGWKVPQTRLALCGPGEAEEETEFKRNRILVPEDGGMPRDIKNTLGGSLWRIAVWVRLCVCTHARHWTGRHGSKKREK